MWGDMDTSKFKTYRFSVDDPWAERKSARKRPGNSTWNINLGNGSPRLKDIRLNPDGSVHFSETRYAVSRMDELRNSLEWILRLRKQSPEEAEYCRTLLGCLKQNIPLGILQARFVDSLLARESDK